jgi:hypothetical protein
MKVANPIFLNTSFLVPSSKNKVVLNETEVNGVPSATIAERQELKDLMPYLFIEEKEKEKKEK